jgi:hypothetical protein
VHVPFAENELDGQDETHDPAEARDGEGQDVQNVDEPAQVVHPLLHSIR